MTPPELLPYIDETSLCDYTVNEHITPDDWELVDNIPVENPLPAMRKFHEDGDDRIDAIDMAYQAYHRGYSWEDIAWTIEPAKGLWVDDTGTQPANGKELLDIFFTERSPDDPRPPYDDDDW